MTLAVRKHFCTMTSYRSFHSEASDHPYSKLSEVWQLF